MVLILDGLVRDFYLLIFGSCDVPAVLVPCAGNVRRCSVRISICSPAKIAVAALPFSSSDFRSSASIAETR